jgi:hypothetical protein
MSDQPSWEEPGAAQTSTAWPQYEPTGSNNDYPGPSLTDLRWPAQGQGSSPTGAPSAVHQGQARFRVRFVNVTSVLIVTHRQAQIVTGTREQLEAAYRKALVHNLLLGWWGIPFGLIWTPVALAANAKALRQVRAVATK